MVAFLKIAATWLAITAIQLAVAFVLSRHPALTNTVIWYWVLGPSCLLMGYVTYRVLWNRSLRLVLALAAPVVTLFSTYFFMFAISKPD
jgi:hypothetical protein